MINTTINGNAVQFEARPEASAVDVLREKLHLTGTKLVCGAGV